MMEDVSWVSHLCINFQGADFPLCSCFLPLVISEALVFHCMRLGLRNPVLRSRSVGCVSKRFGGKKTETFSWEEVGKLPVSWNDPQSSCLSPGRWSWLTRPLHIVCPLSNWCCLQILQSTKMLVVCCHGPAMSHFLWITLPGTQQVFKNHIWFPGPLLVTATISATTIQCKSWRLCMLRLVQSPSSFLQANQPHPGYHTYLPVIRVIE